MKNKSRKLINILIVLVLCVLICGCGNGQLEMSKENGTEKTVSLSDIPEYDGEPYVVIDDNEPGFKESEITDESYEEYSDLDGLGRCGAAEASIGPDIMPTEKRGKIGEVKPSGWQTAKYDCVDGKYLYNRCHLLGYQLTGENANEKNLITGSRYMNVDGMLPFEDMVADYVKETGNHVMYRVTPVFEGDDLVASGVEMEAYSVEDEGEGISFHVYCYNVQPSIEIDYSNGKSRFVEETKSSDDKPSSEYVLNTNSRKFHAKNCGSIEDISESNKDTYTGKREDLISQGYEPCKRCNP